MSCSRATGGRSACLVNWLMRVGDHGGGVEVGVAQFQHQRLAGRRERPGTSRSTRAPLGMRPAVGTPCVTVSACPAGGEAGDASGPCATA